MVCCVVLVWIGVVVCWFVFVCVVMVGVFGVCDMLWCGAVCGIALYVLDVMCCCVLMCVRDFLLRALCCGVVVCCVYVGCVVVCSCVCSAMLCSIVVCHGVLLLLHFAV